MKGVAPLGVLSCYPSPFPPPRRLDPHRQPQHHRQAYDDTKLRRCNTLFQKEKKDSKLYRNG